MRSLDPDGIRTPLTLGNVRVFEPKRATVFETVRQRPPQLTDTLAPRAVLTVNDDRSRPLLRVLAFRKVVALRRLGGVLKKSNRTWIGPGLLIAPTCTV